MNLKSVVCKTLDYMKKPLVRTEYVRTSAYPGLEGMFDGKTVLVTGGTRGIGLAAAKAFHACGASVIVTGRSAERLREIKELFPSNRFYTMEWDIADIHGQDRKMEELDGVIDEVGGDGCSDKQCRCESERAWGDC